MKYFFMIFLPISIILMNPGCKKDELRTGNSLLLDSVRLEVYDISNDLALQYTYISQNADVLFSDLGYHKNADSLIYRAKVETCSAGDSLVTVLNIFRNNHPDYFQSTPWMGCSGPAVYYTTDYEYAASGNLDKGTYFTNAHPYHTNSSTFKFNYSGNDIYATDITGQFDDNQPGTFPYSYVDQFEHPSAFSNQTDRMGFDLNDIIIENYLSISAFSEYGRLSSHLVPDPIPFMGCSDLLISEAYSYTNKQGKLIEHIHINRDIDITIDISYEFDAVYNNRVNKMTIYCDAVGNPRSVFTFFYKP